MNADHAYKMLRVQGYTDDRIYYLTAESQVSRVDNAAETAADAPLPLPTCLVPSTYGRPKG